jgi:hypothetical protein
MKNIIKDRNGRKIGIPVGISFDCEKVSINPEVAISKKLMTPRMNEIRILKFRLIKGDNF